MKIKPVITGVTGMVGEGVLHECLLHPDVEEVLVLTRRQSGIVHPKLKEIVVKDFFDLSTIENQLVGWNACFFCLGVSSIGMKEPEYTRITYDLTMYTAQTLSKLNTGMTFCYISGASTDSTEKGKSMWARVKGRTENDLRKLPFRQAFAFRPGFIQPTRGLKNVLKFYKYVNWLFPLLRTTGLGCTLKQIGMAMIHSVNSGYPKPVLEVRDIVALANTPDK